jgi:polyisoprenoid-binding protein YceI
MATTKWVFDPTHSELGFKIKHLMISSVSGSLKNFDVKVETTGDDLSTAKIQVKADMNSIYTNNAQRDEHLRNADFFEVEKYPVLEFHSTKVEKLDDDNYAVYGALTMKGIAKPVTLHVEYSGVTRDPWGGQRAGFVITGKINRSEWGILFNAALETGGFVLGEEVKISSEIQLVKEAVVIPELV